MLNNTSDDAIWKIQDRTNNIDPLTYYFLFFKKKINLKEIKQEMERNLFRETYHLQCMDLIWTLIEIIWRGGGR